MNSDRIWAGVRFAAVGGRCEAMLQRAAEQGLRIRAVRPKAGGFSAECPARQYLRLAPLARHYRVRLQVQRRYGLYFRLRATLRRTGLLAGALAFGLAVWLLQGLVWSMDLSGLSIGQAARTARALRAAGIQPGTRVTQQLLTDGEYALLDAGGEFSWASVNFERGRLTVEAAPAKAVPDIDSSEIYPLAAKADGLVLSVQLEDGTPLVTAGQQVTKGQILIDTSRAARDGTLSYRRASAVVLAQVSWQGQAEIPLVFETLALTGGHTSWYELSAAGYSFAIGRPETLSADALVRQRHTQLSVLGLPLPVAVTETTAYEREPLPFERSEELARALARLQCEKQLLADFPGAQILTWQESSTLEAGVLHYQASATIAADICQRAE